ncbi:acetate--CoA ligase family protein [Pseudorhodoferax sp. LjRoot39]|uniref:acetate--CoA ligase family protein n=1 Tax=Pseudorhodoferax sp. LjRoot39 TaxID=3342328 RepID=UPI003ECD5165
MNAEARPVYRRAELLRLFEPRSIAIVGISPRAGSFGERTLAQLAQFPGTVHLVNKRYTTIGEQTCYPSLRSLPVVPDCVVLAVGRESVEDYVRECAELGVGGVVVFASGYAETGLPDRQELQARLTEIGRCSGLRILGPNCMGFANYAAETILSFVAYSSSGVPARPAIGIASQSGAMSNALGQATELGVAFSHVLASGNSCDVDIADLVAYLAESPHCGAIACVFEGMADPRRFMEAARIAWDAQRPLVVCKIATGSDGAAAAASHTGSMAGSNEAYRAAFEQAGVIVTERFEDLLEMAGFFAKMPAPRADGVAVISTSGGAAIMAADAAQARGVPLPQPGPAACAVLEQRIPEFGSSRNPCDVTAQVMSDPDSLAACAQALFDDPAFGTVVMAQPQAYLFAVPRIQALGELAQAAGKAACNVLISQWLSGPGGPETERNPHVALFRSMDRCFAALERWQTWHARRGQPAALDAPFKADAKARDEVHRLLDAASGSILTERAGKQVLAAYGIPVVREILTADEDEAARAAAELGYPVALKGESPDLPHKTEAGVVQLHLRDEAEVRRAHALIVQRAHAAGAHVRLTGVLVQPMVPPGLELVVGAKRDPQFGALVVAGLGGILVELLRDTTVALAPVGPVAATSMFEKLRGAALLNGFRGSAPVDKAALADIVTRLSALADDFSDRISEIDVNPLICSPRGIFAVDALLVLAPAPPVTSSPSF